MFIVFGLNIFFNFMPMPPPPEGPARNFITALGVSHYFYVVGTLELVGGALLLAGRFVPLGLTLLGPVIVNILCVHIFLEPSGLPMAIVVSAPAPAPPSKHANISPAGVVKRPAALRVGQLNRNRGEHTRGKSQFRNQRSRLMARPAGTANGALPNVQRNEVARIYTALKR
jgi:hypothetical protein